MKAAIVVLALAAYEPTAGAISACTDPTRGWSNPGAEVPLHSHLVWWDMKSDLKNFTVTATLDGKPVTAKVEATMKAGLFALAVIDVEAKAPGTLKILGTEFEVVAKPAAVPKVAHAELSRFDKQIRHRGSSEIYNALRVTVDVPSAMRAHVKLRRDDKAPWVELDLPLDNAHRFDIGELGCNKNYEPELLEHGVDIDVQLTLADGSTIGIDKFTHVQMPK
ncbi:MAG: hypothetical protein QM831_14940 [Kofleriaceae bacterium]